MAVTPDTRLISILIGGNDVAYVGNLMGLSCSSTSDKNCHVSDAAEIERRFQALPAALDQVIAEVRRRAPDARIILVDYPPTLPKLGVGICPAITPTAVDVERTRGVVAHLEKMIGYAATRNGTGIIRSSVIGTGHDACSTLPYFAGSHPVRNRGWPAPVTYHPTQAGMNRIAAALMSAIDP